MAQNCTDILLIREGTSQSQRFLEALNPESVELNDFSNEDWVQFAYNFAKQVNFFDVTNDKTAINTWEDLFNIFNLSGDISFRGTIDYNEDSDKINSIISEHKENQSLTPHLTLFICFLELLSIANKKFNNLTNKHLKFYYEDVLKIEKQLPVSDKVHIIFELAKRIEDYKISENTKLDAKKDANGTNLVFETVQELIVNKTIVSSIKSLYNDTNNNEIKAAEVANSLDGLGTELPEDEPYWYPFSYTSKEDQFTELKEATVGFALASPMLALEQGTRNIAITITFNTAVSINEYTLSEIIRNIDIYYSSTKKWVGPLRPQESLDFIGDGTVAPKVTSFTDNTLTLLVELESDMTPLSGFSDKILEGNYNTKLPIIKILFNTETTEDTETDEVTNIGYSMFRDLVHRSVKTVDIEVSVTGIVNLDLENDTGVLNSLKPFYPFTTQASKRSNFYINYPELFSKIWNNVTVDILWKNTPDSFKDYYFAYRKEDQARNSRSLYFDSIFIEDTTDLASLKGKNQPEKIVIKSIIDESVLDDRSYSIEDDPNNLIVEDEAHFKATSYVTNMGDDDAEDSTVILFEKEDNLHHTNLNINNEGCLFDACGPIKLSLNQSFLQELFPKIYALALASEDPDTLIPNSAYTPFAESITLNYSAKETVNFSLNTENSYNNNRISLFHIAAFGQYEEHGYLKSKSVSEEILKNSIENKEVWLVPDYCHGGELYIGLEGVENLQTVSLLLQLLEGSENPLASSFEGNQKIEWSVLCDNHWKDLSDYIINDNVDNFLKSGIIELSIPKQATKTNTRLPANITWLKAKIHKEYNAVSKFIDIKAQAVLAEFKNNNNDLSHLNTGLPASTISKLVTRVPHIKSVSQPFSSFGGSALEEDATYFRRVSERLRHKNRAITIWDYEHLVLQEFPEIFKTLCLKHTSSISFVSPGDVTLVVIPDIIDKNVFDIYQPRVSKATLNKIEAFINNLNSMHVKTLVINPTYEPIRVKLNVKFYKNFDENFYTEELKKDITKFLSPWAFDSTKNIAFGVELHTSFLIDYLEDLEYVDYLEDVSFIKEINGVEGDEETVQSPTNPGAILVSAKNHLVSTQISSCTNTITETAEVCQY